MSRPTTKTTIVDGGLRYKTKASGSPFQANAYTATSTMSCFLCGAHRVRSLLGTRKLLGKFQYVCAPSCKELNAAANQPPGDADR